MAKKTKHNAKSLDSNQMLAGILSYIGILVLVPLLAIKVKDRDETIRFHIKQGIILCITWIVAAIVTSFIPVIGGMLSNLVYLLFLIVSIIAIVKAVQMEKWEIPVISSFTHLVKLK